MTGKKHQLDREECLSITWQPKRNRYQPVRHSSFFQTPIGIQKLPEDFFNNKDKNESFDIKYPQFFSSVFLSRSSLCVSFRSFRRFRIFCHWFCNHSNFSNVILVCIMISSAMLAAEDPLKASAERNLVFKLR